MGIFTTSRTGHNTADRAKAWAGGYLPACAIFLMDLGTKFWVHEFTPYGWIQPVTGFFNLVNVRNTGAAFSFLANGSDWSRLFLLAIAVVAGGWLIWMLRKPMPTLQCLAYSLILGGALGNGVDRGARGYVVDFLDFHWRNWHWPAFNIADMAIVCGAVLVIISTFAASRASAS